MRRVACNRVSIYLFDLLIAVLFGFSSALILLTGGGAGTWALYALVIALAGFVLYGAAARLAIGLARSLGSRGRGRFDALCTTISLSPLLAPNIGRRLLAISALRFTVLVLIGAVARAVALDVPL